MRKDEEKITKVAVIPARAGSTRLKDKNIYPLAGKPLICYTVESVIDSECFDTVIVSTDGEKIIDIASRYDVQIHKRPSEYATTKITVLEAMLALMEEIPKHDVFAYFLPTCPFRDSEDIRQGMNLLTQNSDSVVSITEYSEPIQLAMIERENNVFPIFDNLTAGITNSKYIQKYYRPNGAFYISWWKKLAINKNFFIGNVKGYKMSKIKSIDINDIDDMNIAESVLDSIIHKA